MYYCILHWTYKCFETFGGTHKKKHEMVLLRYFGIGISATSIAQMDLVYEIRRKR
jgi:hypothetical protein